MSDTDRVRVLEQRANEALDRYAASAAALQRLATAVAQAGASPQRVSEGWSRYQQDVGPELASRYNDTGCRFTARSLILAADYGTECLRRLVPPERAAHLGAPPPPPPLPGPTDAAGWLAWFWGLAPWATRHQAWSARIYELVRADVAAGRLPPDVLQQVTDAFVRDRLLDYLQDAADLQLDLLTDGLAAGTDVVQQLTTDLTGEQPATDLTVEVHGRAGGVARTELEIDNNRAEPADVVCTVTSFGGFAVAVTPSRLWLEPGRSVRVGIRVDLPAEGTAGASVPAGSVGVTGAGGAPLLVHVRATVAHELRPAVTVRVLDPRP